TRRSCRRELFLRVPTPLSRSMRALPRSMSVELRSFDSCPVVCAPDRVMPHDRPCRSESLGSHPPLPNRSASCNPATAPLNSFAIPPTKDFPAVQERCTRRAACFPSALPCQQRSLRAPVDLSAVPLQLRRVRFG